MNRISFFDHTIDDSEHVMGMVLDGPPAIGSTLFLKRVDNNEETVTTKCTKYKVVDIHHVMAEVHDITEEEADKAWAEVVGFVGGDRPRPQRIRDMHPMVLNLILRQKGWNRIEVMVVQVGY